MARGRPGKGLSNAAVIESARVKPSIEGKLIKTLIVVPKKLVSLIDV